jgi:uncharacterized protein
MFKGCIKSDGYLHVQSKIIRAREVAFVNGTFWQNEPNLTELHYAYGLMATDPVGAVAKLRDLADRGSLMSMVYLGEAYRKGTGVAVDLKKADELYLQAAKGGSVLALYNVGLDYLEKRQFAEAKEAFEISADKGYLASARQLGKIYSRGLGVPKDIDTGRKYLEKALRAGYVFAKRDLAVLLMNGKFGALAKIRGVWLFLVALKDVIVVIFTDPTRELLR